MRKIWPFGPWALAFLMGGVYLLVCLVNHHLFRTYALDLGLYTHALWQYVHHGWAYSSMVKLPPEAMLGSHFDLYLPLFSPLIFLLGTSTLLVVQAMALVLGGVGVYRYFRLAQPERPAIALGAMAHFYLFFAVFSALGFDYHSTVVAACAVPWLFVAVIAYNKVAAWLLLSFMCVGQENVPLFAASISAGLWLMHRHNLAWRGQFAGMTIAALMWFVVVTQAIIPQLATEGAYSGFKYSVLGASFSEALLAPFTHPLSLIKALFFNHTGHPHGDGLKIELHILVLMSGGVLLFRKPAFLLILIPIYAQKLWHDNPAVWGIDHHYSIEFAPVLAIGAWSVIADIARVRWRNVLAATTVVLTALSTVHIMDSTVQYTDKPRIRIYQGAHYRRPYNVQSIHEAMAQIPRGVAVSAQGPLVPHLVLRDTVYLFPIVENARYIVLSPVESPYPFNPDQFAFEVANLRANLNWKVMIDRPEVVIFERLALP